MNQEINDLGAKAGVQWFDYQVEALQYVDDWDNPDTLRLCLYYKTGAGKSVTGLACMVLAQEMEVLVLAPPSTHDTWQMWGRKLGIEVTAISHAKFRQKDFKVHRHQSIIVDEFHLLGGHGGKGWQKLDRMAASLQAPLILMSATPNYNDAERVYCIQHVLDPYSCRGGYLQFLYANCETEENPFGREPKVLGFTRFADAAEYLSALPQVLYLPDDLVYTIDEVSIAAASLPHMDRYGYDVRRHKMIGSIIEERHARIFQSLVDEVGYIHDHVYDVLTDLAGYATTPLLVYANHATVAEALARTLARNRVGYALVTGDLSQLRKAERIQQFREGKHDVLVGTASLATGTDGLDKVCDWLVILDDTDDDSLRRQLIGRIMPRGAGGDASTKHVIRLNLQ